MFHSQAYKYQWAVLSVHIVPHRSTISFWPSKEAWLNHRSHQGQSSQTVPLESFRIHRSSEIGDIYGDMQVIEVILSRASLVMMFESIEAFQEWDKVLQKISSE